MSSNQFYMGLIEIFLIHCMEMIFLSNFSFFGTLDFHRKIFIIFASHLVVDCISLREAELVYDEIFKKSKKKLTFKIFA